MKKIACVLALSLFILLTSCAKQQDTAHLRKPPAVLVEESENVTTFTLPKEVGGEDVQIVISSLILYVPGIDAVATGPRTIVAWHNKTSAENRKFLGDEVERILKIKYETEEIVFIYANDYPDEEDLMQVIADAVLNNGS